MFDELTSTAPAEEALLAIVDTAILDGMLRGAGRTAWHYPLTTDFPVTLTKLSLPLGFYLQAEKKVENTELLAGSCRLNKG